jgi:RNase P subunit RPR2
MRKKWIRIKKERRKIALERIEILKNMIKKKPEFADRYKELIGKIAKKYRIKLLNNNNTNKER